MRFTDAYGEQSCTAGRAAFISGQSVYRTGMSKVGVPGVDIGWAAEDPTIASPDRWPPAPSRERSLPLENAAIFRAVRNVRGVKRIRRPS
jgi:hypothetical protein